MLVGRGELEGPEGDGGHGDPGAGLHLIVIVGAEVCSGWGTGHTRAMGGIEKGPERAKYAFEKLALLSRAHVCTKNRPGARGTNLRSHPGNKRLQS